MASPTSAAAAPPSSVGWKGPHRTIRDAGGLGVRLTGRATARRRTRTRSGRRGRPATGAPGRRGARRSAGCRRRSRVATLDSPSTRRLNSTTGEPLGAAACSSASASRLEASTNPSTDDAQPLQVGRPPARGRPGVSAMISVEPAAAGLRLRPAHQPEVVRVGDVRDQDAPASPCAPWAAPARGGWAGTPAPRATAWTCSRVRGVDPLGVGERTRHRRRRRLPPRRATSCRVTARRRAGGPSSPHVTSDSTSDDQPVWQMLASVCHTRPVTVRPGDGTPPSKESSARDQRTGRTPGATAGAALVWTVGMLGYVLAVMQRTTFGVAGLDAADRFGISPAALSAFVFLQVAVYIAAQLPGGPAGGPLGRPHRARARRHPAGRAASCCWPSRPPCRSRCSPACSWAPATRVVFVAVLALVPRWFAGAPGAAAHPAHRIFGQIGQILSAVPFVALLHSAGWSSAFGAAAAASALAAVLAFAVVRNAPARDVEPRPGGVGSGDRPPGARGLAAPRHPAGLLRPHGHAVLDDGLLACSGACPTW